MYAIQYFVTALLLVASLAATGQDGPPRDYAKALRKERAKKDKHFRRDDDSPIPAAERRAFKGLH